MAIFPTQREWKDLKVKYGIPEKIVKSGSFGTKLDALTKQYVAKKLDKVTPANAAAAATVFPEIVKLTDEWLTGATRLKPQEFANGKPSKDGKANRDKAIETVKEYRTYATTYMDRYTSLKDPFLSARSGGRAKCMERYRAAEAHPDDRTLLHDLYNSGIRNDLGMGFQLALTTYQGDPAVVAMLKDFNKKVAVWNDIILNGDHGGPQAIADDPQKQIRYLAAMKALIDLGDKVLAATK